MRTQLYINGKWEDPLSKKYMKVINPATEDVISEVPAGNTYDIDNAVLAAERAFMSWKSTSGKERASYLRSMGKIVESRIQELSEMETQDCGKPLPESVWDFEDVVGCFDYYADLAEKLDDQQSSKVELPDGDFSAYLRYEPMGVIGAIIPWNYPALMALWKLAPALAAGCTVVLKPSELTPLTALELGSIAEEVKLPPGVLNIVTGTGTEAGAPLVSHPKVHKIAFTGSVPTGSSIMKTVANDVKNISLELGGKSPAIVFESAHIERAVEWVMFGCFWTNGQICSATSRLLIADSIADTFISRLQEETKKILIGNPMEKNVKLGPLVSKSQQNKVLGFINRAQQDGCNVICGGKVPDHLKKGFFVEPTVIVGVKKDMEIWNEEIFGPVLSIMRFHTEEEAIQLANDNKFGLGSAIFSTKEAQTERVAKSLEAGIVWINCSQPCFVQLPWGGFKKSGIGRELGPFGLNSYLEPKQVCKYVADKQFGWYFDAKL